jgi:hypothetical protein
LQQQVATKAREEQQEMELGCGASVHGGDENELRHSLLSSSSSSSSSFPQFFSFLPVKTCPV